jgi:hypothetical protein
MNACVVFELPDGKWFGGVGTSPHAARMRAAINMVRMGHNPRKAVPCIVETFRLISREEYRGILVDTYA